MTGQFDVSDVVETNNNLLEMIKSQNLSISQINGQRKLSFPDWSGPVPGPGCEVFVGKLPRNVYEDTIYPLFASVGQIFEIRLMMDFSGNTRGFCFVMYTTPEDAKKAIENLNNFEIVPNKKIGVVPSTNNCRLCVGPISYKISPSSVIEVKQIF